MKRDGFYRRDPGAALAGMVGMSLEERGVYNTVIDLLYSTWRPLEDNRLFIANWCGCAVQRLNPILRRLIDSGKLERFEEGGACYLTNRRFEDERAAVRGASRSRSGRGEVGEKSGEVGEKSAGVEENPKVLASEVMEKQPLAALERIEREEREETAASAAPKAAEPWRIDPNFQRAWEACGPKMRKRSVSREKTWSCWKRAAASIGSDALLAALRAYLVADGDYPRTGGPGFHIWLNDGTYDHWLATSEAAAAPADPDEAWRRKVREFCRNQFWNSDDGPRPGKPGCLCPASILAELEFSTPNVVALRPQGEAA